MNIGPVQISVQSSFSAAGGEARSTEGQNADTGNASRVDGKASGRKDNQPNGSGPTQELTRGQLDQVQRLKQVDTAVRTHEMAHIAAGGQYVRSSASYQFQRGPDGKSYAVAGEVGIDIAKVPNDPRATIAKMQTVVRAALAPMDPSAQDRSVAAKAAQIQAEASIELTQLQMEKNRDLSQNGRLAQAQSNSNGYVSDGKSAQTGTIIHVVG